jgi:hypothetical protein
MKLSLSFKVIFKINIVIPVFERPEQIHQPRPGFNPQTPDPETSMVTTRPLKFVSCLAIEGPTRAKTSSKLETLTL